MLKNDTLKFFEASTKVVAQPHRVLSYVGCQEIYQVESSVDSVPENVTAIGKKFMLILVVQSMIVLYYSTSSYKGDGSMLRSNPIY